MFGKKKTAEKQNGQRGPAAEGSISIIGPGMRIVGDVITEGTVRVEGTIEGTIRAEKAVVVGREGVVVGEVYTQDAVVGGRVQGTLIAESRLELQSTSEIVGEIRARAQHLQLDEGARFNGQIQMLGEEPPPRALPREATRETEYAPVSPQEDDQA